METTIDSKVQELESVEDLELLESGDVVRAKFVGNDIYGGNEELEVYQGPVVFVFKIGNEFLFTRDNNYSVYPRSYFVNNDNVVVEDGVLLQKSECGVLSKIGMGEIIPSLGFYQKAMDSLWRAGI